MTGDFHSISEPLDEDDDKTALQEGYKLMVDASKQLATLSTGTIVILVTFLKDVFDFKNGTLTAPWLVSVTLASLGISLPFSVLVIWAIPLRLVYTRNWALSKRSGRQGLIQWMELGMTRTRHWFYRISLLTFIVGVGSFAFFALLNLYSALQ